MWNDTPQNTTTRKNARTWAKLKKARAHPALPPGWVATPEDAAARSWRAYAAWLAH